MREREGEREGGGERGEGGREREREWRMRGSETEAERERERERLTWDGRGVLYASTHHRHRPCDYPGVLRSGVAEGNTPS